MRGEVEVEEEEVEVEEEEEDVVEVDVVWDLLRGEVGVKVLRLDGYSFASFCAISDAFSIEEVSKEHDEIKM